MERRRKWFEYQLRLAGGKLKTVWSTKKNLKDSFGEYEVLGKSAMLELPWSRTPLGNMILK